MKQLILGLILSVYVFKPTCVYVCVCAVSYTHLDVYKRQGLVSYNSWAGPITAGLVSYNARAGVL